MADGGQLLGEFLRAHRLSSQAAGTRLGVSRVTVRAWIKGWAIPHPARRDEIEWWTRGAVLASSWPPSKFERQAAEAASRVRPFGESSRQKARQLAVCCTNANVSPPDWGKACEESGQFPTYRSVDEVQECEIDGKTAGAGGSHEAA